MFAAFLVIGSVQFSVELGKAEELARKAAPEAKWALRAVMDGGLILSGKRQYKIDEEISKRAAQGPAQWVISDGNPTIYENEQLFLLDVGKPTPKWIPYEPLKHTYGVYKVYLGKGREFRWFARGSLAFIDSLKRSAKLTGGDDLLQIAAETLQPKNVSSVSYATAYHMLSRAKDASLPYLRKHIAENGSKGSAIAILGQIRTAKAGYELLRLYKTGDKHVRSEVRSAAAYRPTLPMLKPVYRDLLAEGDAVIACSEAAIQFGWKDFLPAVRREWKETRSPLEAMVLYEAMDRLGPQKLPASVTKAARVMRDAGYRPEMQAEFIGCPDPIYRGLIAHWMLDYATKAGYTLRPQGEELWDTLPTDLRAKLSNRFSQSSPRRR